MPWRSFCSSLLPVDSNLSPLGGTGCQPVGSHLVLLSRSRSELMSVAISDIGQQIASTQVCGGFMPHITGDGGAQVLSSALAEGTTTRNFSLCFMLFEDPQKKCVWALSVWAVHAFATGHKQEDWCWLNWRENWEIGCAQTLCIRLGSIRLRIGKGLGVLVTAWLGWMREREAKEIFIKLFCLVVEPGEKLGLWIVWKSSQWGFWLAIKWDCI